MAGVHQFKIKSSGRIGNVDFRLNLDNQSSSNSDNNEEESIACHTRDGRNRRQMHQAGEYEGNLSSDSAIQDKIESERETDTDNQYTNFKDHLKDALSFTGKLLNTVTFTRKTAKGNKDLKKQMKRDIERHKLKRSLHSEYFKKDKLKQALTSVLKDSSDLIVYGLGSYFEEPASDFNSQRNRFSTFFNYVGNGVPASLAKDGFYHNHDEGSTSTKCFFCGLTRSTWGPNDDVSIIHRQMSPNCTFTRSSSDENIDQQDTVMESVSLRANITDVQSGNRSDTGSAVNETVRCIDLAQTRTEGRTNREQLSERRGIQARNHPFGASSQSNARNLIESENQRQETVYGTNLECVPLPRSRSQGIDIEQASSRNMVTSNVQNSGELRRNPKHPDYANYQSRVHSFNKWPQSKPLPEGLAEIGFFYTGLNDIVRCFYCDGGLGSRETGDDIMDEHFRMFPHCDFIQSVRGEVRNVLRNAEAYQGQRNVRGEEQMDPLRRRVVEAMTGMGFTSAAAKEAVMAVNDNATGQYDVLLNKALTWTFERQGNGMRDEQAQPQAGTSLRSPDTVAGASASSSGYNQGIVSLRAENQELKELPLCKICRDQRMDILFLPCGHLVCCNTCAAEVHRCPSCKAVITGKMAAVIPH